MQLADCRITLLLNAEGLYLSVVDWQAGVEFLQLTLTPEQTCKAFARQGWVPCQYAEVRGLDQVGHTGRSPERSTPRGRAASRRGSTAMARPRAATHHPVARPLLADLHAVERSPDAGRALAGQGTLGIQ